MGWARVAVACALGLASSGCAVDSFQEHDIILSHGGYALVRVEVADGVSTHVTFEVPNLPAGARYLLYVDEQTLAEEAEGGRSVGWFDGSGDLARADRCHLSRRGCSQPGVGRLVAVAAPDERGEARLRHGAKCPSRRRRRPCVYYYSVVAAPRDEEPRRARLEVAVNSGPYVGEMNADVRQLQ